MTPSLPAFEATSEYYGHVAHGYDRVRLEIVWRVVDEELAPLERQVKAILEEFE